MPREAWVLVKAMVSDTYPDQGLPGPQPPLRPPGYPDQGLPGPQPIPGWPAYPGGPGGGLPGNAPRPDQGLPGPQPIPGWPAYPGGPGGGLPGNAPRPDNTLPGQQPGIWGPTDPRPTPPIYIPIVLPPDPEYPNLPTHPIYLPIYPDNSLPGPQPRPDQSLPGDQPYPDNTLPEQERKALIAKIMKVIEFLTGNLPTDPDERPEPV